MVNKVDNPHSAAVVRLLQENRNALLAREDLQLQRMAKSWLQIERSLHSDMELLAYQIEDAKAAGKAVTEQLLRKQKLYQLLDKKLEEQVLKYAKTTAVTDISAEQAAYAKAGVQSAVAAIKTSYINMVPSFSVLSPTAFETMVGLLGDGTPLYRLLKQAYPDALDGIVKGLLQGVARGIGPNQTAKEMAQGMGMGLQRITLIARTEQLRMWRIATAQQYQESKVVERSKRLCMKDERTCLACLVMDGQVIPLDETMSDHPRGRAEVSGNLVLSSSPTALITHSYNGDIVVIHAASGNFLAVTPTHPVLTRRGWIAAKFIHEGDYVVSYGGTDWTSKIVGPDEDYVPTRVEEMTRSFNMFSLGRVPESAQYLYDNGGSHDSKVDVVFVNRFLWDSFDPSFQEQLRKFYFGRRCIRPGFFYTSRSFNEIFFAGLLSFILIDPIFQHNSLLFNSFSNVSKFVGLSDGKSFNFGVKKDFMDWPSGNIERFSNGIFRFTTGISGDDISSVNGVFRPPEQPLTLEQVRQSLRTSMPKTSRFSDVITSQIKFDRVSHTDVRSFFGHVYSLQTEEGWYCSGGIISHNCTSVPVVTGAPEITWELGKDWFLKQPEKVQRDMMGNAMYQLWKEKQFDLSDLAGIHHNDIWGDSPYVKTYKEIKAAKEV